MNKQISLTLPENLFKASKEYSKEMGYKNVQEFILDSIRRRTIFDESAEMDMLEAEVDRNPNTRVFKTKEEALAHLDSL
jgi:hypothetical protein